VAPHAYVGEVLTKRAAFGMGWSRAGVRLFAGLLITLQVIQGVSDPVSISGQSFTQSYYLVTYNHGFVRRGLAGELFHLLFGVPTRNQVDIAVDLVTVLVVGSVVVLVELLVRRGTTGSFSMAILLAASPFTIDFFIVDLRPDLLAVVVLVALGIVLTRVTHAMLPWIAVIGLAFGALVLVHEDVVLIQIPWAIVLVTLATLGGEGVLVGRSGSVVTRQLAERLAALLAPSVIATFAVLAFGLPNAHKVAVLRHDVASFPLRGGTLFTYLPDSVHTSIRLVESIPTSVKAHTVFLGGTLVVLQIAWVLLWVKPRLTAVFTRPGNRALGLGLGVVLSIATVVLFATGIDWLRWFADCGSAWLIVQSFSVLLLEPERGIDDLGHKSPYLYANDSGRDRLERNADRTDLSHWTPALAVYLAAVPPIDIVLTSGLLRHFFFFV
jgi:hypothetical protein